MFNFDGISLKEIITIAFTLFAVIDMLGSIPILVSLKGKIGGTIKSTQTTLVSGGLMILFLFFGKQFLDVLSLDIRSFAVAGSIVIFILGLEMILGMEFFKQDKNDKTSSVIPIAFPIIAGSGTLTTIMSLRANYAVINILIGILINCVIIYLVLRSLTWIEKVLGPSGLLVIRKFFGVILLAIAVKIFTANIMQFER
jgi:multiple antibiotic resistance protein